jgi:hypothetical protein
MSISSSIFHDFLGSLQLEWFFLSLLKAACHSLSPTTNTHGVFSIFAEGQGHMPLPRVKVVTFLRDKNRSVMSTSRQTNGTHGCLMPPQKVCYHLKVICQVSKERFGADLQSSDITSGMSTNTFEIYMYQSLRAFGSRKSVHLFGIQFKTVETLSKEMLPPPLFTQHWRSGKQCATGMPAVSRYVRPIFRDTFMSETVLCGCY